MRMMIIGGTGYLGGAVVRQALAAGHEVVATSRRGRPEGPGAGPAWRALDLVDRDGTAEAVADVRPDAVVNAAFRQDDWATTADGAGHVALAAARTGARLVHVSSDAVFSGDLAPGRYPESAAPDPVTPYGAAKAAAETVVAAVHPGAAIARTSLIVGDGRSVHERRIAALAAGTGDGGVLFTDDVRCPVHVADLAAALLELAASDAAGVHHTAGADAISRHELGRLVAARAGLDPDALRTARRADSGLPGPVDVRLDCTRTQSRLATRLRGAREFLAAA